MPDARSRPERPPAERLPLGQASRLLGVDPDTLRRWADEGRVPAFTTLGGHRRFERRALERLVATRRTGAIGALGGVGDSTDRLNAAYRRRYGETHGDGPELRAIVPEGERDAFRDTGRRLAEALVRYLDGSGPARNDAEAEAIDLAALLGERVRRQGIPLGSRRLDVRRGQAAVPRRAAARRPAQRRQRRSPSGSCTTPRPGCWTACCWCSSRPTPTRSDDDDAVLEANA